MNEFSGNKFDNVQGEIIERISVYPLPIQKVIFETLRLVKEYSISDAAQQLAPIVRRIVKEEVEK